MTVWDASQLQFNGLQKKKRLKSQFPPLKSAHEVAAVVDLE